MYITVRCVQGMTTGRTGMVHVRTVSTYRVHSTAYFGIILRNLLGTYCCRGHGMQITVRCVQGMTTGRIGMVHVCKQLQSTVRYTIQLGRVHQYLRYILQFTGTHTVGTNYLWQGNTLTVQVSNINVNTVDSTGSRHCGSKVEQQKLCNFNVCSLYVVSVPGSVQGTYKALPG